MVFPFGELPGELRNMVYDQLIVDMVFNLRISYGQNQGMVHILWLQDDSPTLGFRQIPCQEARELVSEIDARLQPGRRRYILPVPAWWYILIDPGVFPLYLTPLPQMYVNNIRKCKIEVPEYGVLSTQDITRSCRSIRSLLHQLINVRVVHVWIRLRCYYAYPNPSRAWEKVRQELFDHPHRIQLHRELRPNLPLLTQLPPCDVVHQWWPSSMQLLDVSVDRICRISQVKTFDETNGYWSWAQATDGNGAPLEGRRF